MVSKQPSATSERCRSCSTASKHHSHGAKALSVWLARPRGFCLPPSETTRRPKGGVRPTCSLPDYGEHSLIPVKDTNCGLSGALSLTETAPILKEFSGGIHLTVMAQDFPAPRLASQLFVSEKAAPVIPMPVILNVVVPKSLSVVVLSVMHSHPTLFTFLQAKVRLVGDKVAFGPENTTLPLNATDCGLPGALSVTKSVPFMVSEVLGVKVTLITQFAPAARVEPQVLVSPKLALAAILTMLSVAVPELLNVTVCAGLVVPTTSKLKVRLVADKVTLGDPPTDPPPQPLSRHNPQSMSETYFFMVPSSA